MRWLRFFVLSIVLILLVGCASTRSQKSNFRNGDYPGEETSWPDMKVLVQVREGRIQAIQIIQAGGTPSYTDQVIAVLPDRVIQANSTEVDGVTGATLSCESFLSAVRDAVAKAK